MIFNQGDEIVIKVLRQE